MIAGCYNSAIIFFNANAVYCDKAELFVNGKSAGVKKRNSQDFPAAGLRWNVVLNKGNNNVKVIAKKKRLVVEDAINFQYQIEKWGNPAKLLIEKLKEEIPTAFINL